MKTDFNPLFHGYPFPNRFQFKGLSRITKFIKSKLIYGMCGGMVFSALDFYFDQNKIPKYALPHELPDSYAKYLWKRQTESVPFSVLIKIVYFAILPKNTSFQKSIQNELPKIIEKLQDGLPTPLVIIRSSLFQNPTHNHQVLVTSFEETNDDINLFLYDPNHPLIQPSLIINKSSNQITQSTGEVVRGFFINQYTYKCSVEE